MFQRKIYQQRKMIVLENDEKLLAPDLKHNCSDHLLKKYGPYGIFYTCCQCLSKIPADDEGLPQKPIGICSICSSYVYQGISKAGNEYPICSRLFKH